MVEKVSNITLNEKLYVYNGDNTYSCIYLFKPKQEAVPAPEPQKTDYYVINGSLVKSVHVFASNS